MSYLIAGVGTAQFFDKATNALILTTKTLTTQGLNFSSTAEEARGGAGNALLGKYYHDSAFTLELTDQLFDLQYLALNCGGSITAGADMMTSEQVEVTVADTITVSQTPVKFGSATVGWVKKSTDDDSAYVAVTFSGKNASLTGAQVGDVYCVKYFYNNASARMFKVNTAYVPKTVHAVLTFPMFTAGDGGTTYTSSSQVGEIQVDVPNFQFAGSQELSLTSGGISTASLSGSALASHSGNGSCSDTGYYAEVKEIIYGKGVWDNVVSLAVVDSDIDLAVNETQKIEVMAIYSDGTVPTKVDNSLLTFTSDDETIALVSANGVVTGKATGSTNISIIATSQTSLSAYAVVTVA